MAEKSGQEKYKITTINVRMKPNTKARYQVGGVPLDTIAAVAGGVSAATTVVAWLTEIHIRNGNGSKLYRKI